MPRCKRYTLSGILSFRQPFRGCHLPRQGKVNRFAGALRQRSARLCLSAQSSRALSLPQSYCLNPERSPTAPSSEGAEGAPAPRTDFHSAGAEAAAAARHRFSLGGSQVAATDFTVHRSPAAVHYISVSFLANYCNKMCRGAAGSKKCAKKSSAARRIFCFILRRLSPDGGREPWFCGRFSARRPASRPFSP